MDDPFRGERHEEMFSPDELSSHDPFLYQFIRTALPRVLLKKHVWEGARREFFAFQPNLELWSVELTPQDDEQPFVGYMARRDGDIFPLPFDEATFLRAFGGDGLALSEKNALGYLKLYFELTDRVRRHDRLVSDPQALVFEGEAGSEDAQEHRQRIRDFASVVKGVDAYGRICCEALTRLPRQLFLSEFMIKKDGEIVEGSTGEDGEFVEGGVRGLELLEPDKAPDEAPGRLGLDSQWAGQDDFLATQTLSIRRGLAELEEAHSTGSPREWRPEDAAGDIEVVTEEANKALERRQANYRWETILPPERADLESEAKAFVASVNRRCPDLQIEVPSNAFPAQAPETSSESELRAEVTDFTIRRKRLPFYPGYGLYEVVERAAGRPRATHLLWRLAPADVPELSQEVGELVPLYGIANTIHQLNHAFRLNLDGDYAREYLDFFGDFVKADAGLFHVVETLDDLRWRGLSDEQQKRVSDLVFPIRLWPVNGAAPDAPLVLDACLVHGMDLHHAVFELERNGTIEMTDDHMLVRRLEITPELPTPKTHFHLRQPRLFEARDEPS